MTTNEAQIEDVHGQLKSALGRLMASLGRLAIEAPVIASLFVIRGYVLSTLWMWFIVPLGVQPIGVPFAIGLLLMVKFVRGLSRSDLDGKEYSTKEKVLHYCSSATFSLACLLFGWIVLQWVPA